MLTILHRHRATALAALPVLFAASLALGACSQGTEPRAAGQAAVTSPAGETGTATTTKASGDAAATPSSDATKDASGGSDPTTSTGKSGTPDGEGAPPDMSQGGPKTVVIMVKGKDVEPKPGSVKIKKGEPLLLVVITDQAGEVHVHGVDVEKETKKGLPTQIPLTFDEKGSFEVELHDPELLLTKIVVS